jgi:hypothetical protein
VHRATVSPRRRSGLEASGISSERTYSGQSGNCSFQHDPCPCVAQNTPYVHVPPKVV